MPTAGELTQESVGKAHPTFVRQALRLASFARGNSQPEARIGLPPRKDLRIVY